MLGNLENYTLKFLRLDETGFTIWHVNSSLHIPWIQHLCLVPLLPNICLSCSTNWQLFLGEILLMEVLKVC